MTNITNTTNITQRDDYRIRVRQRALRLLICVAAMSLLAQGTHALPEYLKIYAADPASRPELRTQCSVCHINPRGGGPRNEFGMAFARAGKKITPELRQQFASLFLTTGEQQQQAPSQQQDQSLPISFVRDSQSEVVVEINGRNYLINTRKREVTLLSSLPKTTEPQKLPQVAAARVEVNPDIYEPSDVRAINLPTALPIPKGSLWVDFTHRFPFSEVNNTAGLFGLDGFAFPAFGVTYGITDRINAGVYRAPTGIGRPIEIFVGASLLDERKGHPFNLAGRVALEGRDNFQRNFTTSFELTLARSITRHAQVYIVPTLSLGDRPITPDPTQNAPGTTAMALGFGLSVNIRPSITLMAEANMRLNEEARYENVGLGIHRPVVGFGIEKASSSRKHAFSLIFTNGPGTTFSQRSMTRGLFFADDSMSGMTIGFNLTRRLF